MIELAVHGLALAMRGRLKSTDAADTMTGLLASNDADIRTAAGAVLSKIQGR